MSPYKDYVAWELGLKGLRGLIEIYYKLHRVRVGFHGWS